MIKIELAKRKSILKLQLIFSGTLILSRSVFQNFKKLPFTYQFPSDCPFCLLYQEMHKHSFWVTLLIVFMHDLPLIFSSFQQEATLFWIGHCTALLANNLLFIFRMITDTFQLYMLCMKHERDFNKRKTNRFLKCDR